MKPKRGCVKRGERATQQKMKPTERRPSRAGGRPRGAGARRPPTDRVTTPAQPSRRAAANVYSDESGEDAPEDKPGASRRFDVSLLGESRWTKKRRRLALANA